MSDKVYGFKTDFTKIATVPADQSSTITGDVTHTGDVWIRKQLFFDGKIERKENMFYFIGMEPFGDPGHGQVRWLEAPAVSVGHADTATSAGASSMKLYTNANELNFGGSYNSASNRKIFFGYRSEDGRPTPRKFELSSQDGFNISLGCGSIFSNNFDNPEGDPQRRDAASIMWNKAGGGVAGLGAAPGNNTVKLGIAGDVETGSWLGAKITFLVNGTVRADDVWGAVANDYADSIEVPDETELEAGRCYCFDGEHYYKSTKYLDEGFVGIHSDTYAFNTGKKERGKDLDIAVSGFALAYVDKVYKPGTPLTCTENGCLTEIKLEDKRDFPERIVGAFWKEETAEVWEPETKNVKVNGRHWVKVR